MRAYQLLLLLLAMVLIVAGCGTIQMEVGFKQPAELTATAVVQVPQPTAPPKPQLGKLAFVRGGDIWVKELPDGEAKRLTTDGRSGEPKWSPTGEWIAFRKDDRVWVVHSSGAQLHQLIGSGPVDDFAWSPLADRIAFSSLGALWTVGADGSDIRQPAVALPKGRSQIRLGALAWSPDGRWLAFERSETRTDPQAPLQIYQGLWVANADAPSGAVEVHANPDPRDTQSLLASWSADGQNLLFWQGRYMSASIVGDGLPLLQVPVAGGAPVEISPRMLAHRELLDWSVDGRLMLSDGGGKETWTGKRIAVASNQGLVPLSDESRSDLFPAWSPDGRWIAFASGPSIPLESGPDPAKEAVAQRRIWLMQPDGSARRQLTSDPGLRDERPLWSKDGNFLLFGRLAGGQAQLWVMRADGSDLQQVVDELTPAPTSGSAAAYGYLDWPSSYDWWTGTRPVQVPPASPSLAQPSTASTAASTPSSSPTVAVPTASPTLEPAPKGAGQMTVEEHPIVGQEEDGPENFEYRRRIDHEILKKRAFWRGEGPEEQAPLRNRVLGKFGYRLVFKGRPPEGGNASYDLYRGSDLLLSNLTMALQPAVNARGDDFAMVVWDHSRESLVSRSEVVPWATIGYGWMRPVFAGNDLVVVERNYEGKQYTVRRGGAAVYSFSMPAVRPDFPVKGLEGWGDRWVLEVDGQVVVDGRSLNQELGYDEIFGWQLIQGRPFYFFRKNGRIGVSYDGKVLPQQYDDVIHYKCCGYALYNAAGNDTMVWFHALRDGTWHYVEMGVFDD